MSEDRAMLVVVEELVDHDSSSGAKRAAGCTTSSGRGINVEPDVVVVLVVLVVVRLERRLPSCLPRNAKTPASFTEPVTTTRYNGVSLSDVATIKESYCDFIFRQFSLAPFIACHLIALLLLSTFLNAFQFSVFLDKPSRDLSRRNHASTTGSTIIGIYHVLL